MPNSQQHVGREERFVRRYEYDDRHVVAVDLPVGGDDLDVDIVGDTAILVMDLGDRVREAELDLPDGAATFEANNGVLAIEVAK